MVPKKINPIFLLFCVLLAALFIFDHIGVRSFWLDEAAVGNFLLTPFRDLFARSLVEGHPFSYILVLKIWSIFFGDGEIALRAFSATGTLFLIVALYKTTENFFPLTRAKYWAAFLAATNFFLLWHSTQTKGYTFIALVGLLSFFCFWTLVRKFSKKWLLVYLLVTLFGTYSHPWFAFTFGSQMLALILFRKSIPAFMKILAAQLVIVVLSLPYWWGLFALAGSGAAAWEGGSISLATLWESLKMVTLHLEWPYFIFSSVAVYFFVKRRRLFGSRFVCVSLGTYLLLAPLAAVLVSQVSPAYVVGRYEMVVLPALILLAARLFSEMGFWLSLTAGVFILFSAFQAVQTDRQTVVALTVFDDRVAASRLYDKISNGDMVIATDLSLPPFTYYFRNNQSKRFNLIAFPVEMARHPAWKNLPKMMEHQEDYRKEAKLLVVGQTEGNIWVIYNSSNPLNKLLYDELASRFKLVSVETLPPVHQPLWFDAILQFSRHPGAKR